MGTSDDIRVLSLNCWGIPWEKTRIERITALVGELKKSKYDVVLLQEIWHVDDQKLLSTELKEVYPYWHYYYSGVLGSGCMILTKYRIINALHVPYMNFGIIYHTGGDWFAKKAMCYALLEHEKGPVAVFFTHTHAKYLKNHHDALRNSQLFQFARFIKTLTEGKDVPIIVAGDLNMETHETGIKFLLKYNKLKDSCAEVNDIVRGDYNTCNTVENPFSSAYETPCRIDYILFSSQLQCNRCENTMKEIEGNADKLWFSDHIGLEASFSFKASSVEEESNNDEIVALTREFKGHFDEGLADNQHKVGHIMALIGVPILLIFLEQFSKGVFTGLSTFTIVMAILFVNMLFVYLLTLRLQRRVYMGFLQELQCLFPGSGDAKK